MYLLHLDRKTYNKSEDKYNLLLNLTSMRHYVGRLTRWRTVFKYKTNSSEDVNIYLSWTRKSHLGGCFSLFTVFFTHLDRKYPCFYVVFKYCTLSNYRKSYVRIDKSWINQLILNEKTKCLNKVLTDSRRSLRKLTGTICYEANLSSYG